MHSTLSPNIIGARRASALRFLENTFNQSTQRWQDFSTRTSGSGTQWITAFVLAHTGGTFSPIEQSWLEQIKQVSKPIGYNDHVPPDCDSTVWALTVLRRAIPLPASSELLATIFSRFIASHWVGLDGRCGLSTYNQSSPIVEYKKSNGGWNDFCGWTQTPCDEITALGLPLMLLIGAGAEKQLWIERAEQWVSSLRSNGVTSYWWSSDAYALRVTLDALKEFQKLYSRLAASASLTIHELVLRIQDIATHDRLSAFDKANLILAISSKRNTNQSDLNLLQRLVDELLEEQKDFGAWVSQDVMRIPYPNDASPWSSNYFEAGRAGTGGLLSDSGVLSTAVCCAALSSLNGKIE